MLHRGKPKDSSSSRRKVTPPSPTYMNNEQFAAYLASLRETRANRPGGARPLPPSTRPRQGAGDEPGTPAGRSSVASIASTAVDSIQSEPAAGYRGAGFDPARPRPRGSRPSIAGSVTSRYSANTVSGRDYFPIHPGSTPLRPSDVVPSATYMERGQRWMEKEEAFSLHQAMDAVESKNEQKRQQEQEQALNENLNENEDGDENKNRVEDEETRLYDAALNEAAELVYRHEHGIKPRERDAPYRYRPHMRRNSYAHARTASVGRYGGDIGPTGLARDTARSFSGSSCGSIRDSSPESDVRSIDAQPGRRTGTDSGIGGGGGGGAAYAGSVSISGSGSRRRSSMRRNISGEIAKPFSGDQIWEEPEGTTPEPSGMPPQLQSQSQSQLQSQPLGTKTRNSPNTVQVQFAPDLARDAEASPADATKPKPLARIEIHKNPPSQSRNANYTRNGSSLSPHAAPDVPRKNGVEIRGDDIRQATSMRRMDRSPNLPTPSAVSDSPGRPIVSFDKNWKAPEEAAADPVPAPDEPDKPSKPDKQDKPRQAERERPQPTVPALVCTPPVPRAPATAASPSRRTAPVPRLQVEPDMTPQVPVPVPVPIIAVSNESGVSVPSIVLPDNDNENDNDEEDSSNNNMPSIPAIVVADDAAAKPQARPLPVPGSTPHARRTADGGRPRGHWSPAPAPASATGASHRATAVCHECSHPIEGRFVALSGGSERFHPQCFRCYACGTALENLEISPEPDHFYAARLERIARRAAGERLEEAPGQTMAEDGDARLRFYCHLDWHDLFAPQCKHCKTPILGEHVVALGAHWHYGHFFCAECGDPFERGMTHIEKDGYAWCVACQTKRTERRAPKCKRCRLPVLGPYVKALGTEWHDECFRCATCAGGFDDGQIFPVGEGRDARVLCTECRAQELKM
ncbi:hypothetical protein F4777DRAFT_550689 [Nemania sp. FL0916]|nr:hypothetical protein F4777DRAFT_550689 [Nemania sp. FL0916]